MAKAVQLEPRYEQNEDERSMMMLMIPGYFWNVLVLQAEAEGTGPAMIFDKALRQYLEQHGDPEVIKYIWDIARGGG